MHREFSILRMKQSATGWEFPFSWDESSDWSPVGGPFSAWEQGRLEQAIAQFGRARPVRDGRRAWVVRGVELWLASDGTLYIEGALSLDWLAELVEHLEAALPHLLVEDRITGVVHDRRSLSRLAQRELPFDVAA